MIVQSTLTEEEVRLLVTDWYGKLDRHAPVEELLPLLDDERLEMRFPETTVRGAADFPRWYSAVTSEFFDEVHELASLDVSLEGDEAAVTLVVDWQRRTWDPPAARSTWLGFHAAQRWTVRRSPSRGIAVIATYIVDSLTPMQGSTSP